MNPQEILLELSRRAEEIISVIAPNAKKMGQRWQMGNLDGDPGSSCGIYRGRGGVLLATDQGETINLLQLWKRIHGLTWAQTLHEARKFLGINTIKPAFKDREIVAPSKANVRALSRDELVRKYLHDRAITDETAKLYKASAHLRRSEHNEAFVCYPYILPTGTLCMIKSTGVKRTPEGKKDIWTSKPFYTLWGWWLITEKTESIIICEGEEDAMVMSQMQGIPENCVVMSVPNGTSGMAWIDNDYDALTQFATIYLALDQDEAGEKCSRAVAKRLGQTRCLRLKWDKADKDASELWLSGTRDVTQIMAHAECYQPEGINTPSQTKDKLQELIERRQEEAKSNDFVFPHINFRLRPGECVGWIGAPGHGKSQFLYQVLGHEMFENNKRVGFVSCEIPSEQIEFEMMWQKFGKMPGTEYLDEDLSLFDDRLWFLDKNEDGKSDWKVVREEIEYGVRRFGWDVVAIDSLRYLSDKTDWEGQESVAYDCKKMAQKLNVCIILVCHTDAKKKGQEQVHELEDILGGQGIGAAVLSAVSIWRNKLKEKETDEKGFPDEDKPDGKLYVCKQRITGHTVFKPFWWDKRSRKLMLTKLAPTNTTETNEPF